MSRPISQTRLRAPTTEEILTASPRLIEGYGPYQPNAKEIECVHYAPVCLTAFVKLTAGRHDAPRACHCPTACSYRKEPSREDRIAEASRPRSDGVIVMANFEDWTR